MKDTRGKFRAMLPLTNRMGPGVCCCTIWQGDKNLIQDTQSQVTTSLASVYQFFSPFINAALGIAGSFLVYCIKDRDPSTREFERQTKRLQFWKAFYDLQAIAPLKPDVDYQIRCKQTLESAAFWVVAVPTKAARCAKWFSLLILSFAMAWLYPFLLSKMPPVQPGGESGRVLFALILFACLALVLYQIVYDTLRGEVTRWLLWLAKHVPFFAFFGEMFGT